MQCGQMDSGTVWTVGQPVQSGQLDSVDSWTVGQSVESGQSCVGVRILDVTCSQHKVQTPCGRCSSTETFSSAYNIYIYIYVVYLVFCIINLLYDPHSPLTPQIGPQCIENSDERSFSPFSPVSFSRDRFSHNSKPLSSTEWNSSVPGVGHFGNKYGNGG